MWDMVNNKGFNKSNIKLNKKRIKGADFIHPSRWMITSRTSKLSEANCTV